MIKLEDGLIKSKKSCELCSHIKVCKFYDKAEALFKSNEFYKMNIYLENNNNLKAWSENSSCQFYESFVHDKKLLEKEVKYESSILNTLHLSSIIHEWFYIEKYPEHKDYFTDKIEIEKNKPHNKNLSDISLIFRLLKTSHGRHLYTVETDEFSYTMSLVELFEYFGAFKN